MTLWKEKGFSKFGLYLVSVCLLLHSYRAQETQPATIAPSAAEVTEKNVTTKPTPVLTGDPQKDYIHDPNLPRELKGFSLSDYPFYKRVPNVEFNFTCDDRHDGFYASIPHKCQVYHNCLFGVRYDFLCANYTAFDQANFICHFASEVDCKNSEMYFDRNNALYKEETTTTTTTAAPQVRVVYVERPRRNRRPQASKTGGGERRRVANKQTDDYYYDYQDEKPQPANGDDYYYYDDVENATTTTTTTRRPLPQRRPNRPLKTRLGAQSSHPNHQRPQSPSEQVVDYDVGRQTTRNEPLQRQQGQNRPLAKRRRRRRKKTTTTTTTTPAPEYYDEYYDYEYYDEIESSSTTTTTTITPPKRRQPQRGRLSVEERRQALLESRKSQLQTAAQKKLESMINDEPHVATHDAAAEEQIPQELLRDQTFVEGAPVAFVEDVPLDYDYSPRQNARQRPGTFKRPRTRPLREQTSRA